MPSNTQVLEILQNIQNERIGVKSSMSAFNHRTVNSPEFHGRINPEDQEAARQAADVMREAEHAQKSYDAEAVRLQESLNPYIGKKIWDDLNETNKKTFGTNKARYQGAKGQWQKSGLGMTAKSRVAGFDDLSEDDTKTYDDDITKTH